MINGERMNIFSGEFHPYRSVAARGPRSTPRARR
jgi:hypothetical protein